MKLFTYGTLMPGYGNARLLDGLAEFIGYTKTLNGFSMMSLPGFPWITDSVKFISELPIRLPVYGALYRVGETGLAQTDVLEGNGHFYERFWVPVWDPGSNDSTGCYAYRMMEHNIPDLIPRSRETGRYQETYRWEPQQ